MFPYEISKTSNGYSYCARTTNGINTGTHTHDGYEIIHVCDGGADCVINNHAYKLSAGDTMLIAPFTPHLLTAPDNGTYSRQVLHLEQGSVESLFKSTGCAMPDFDNAGYVHSKSSEKYRLSEGFSQIHEYALSDRAEADFIILTCAAQLLTKISEAEKYESDDDTRQKRSIRKITDYINENLTLPLNLDSIARCLYMDKSYICRLFKNETGITINTYINARRVAMAKNMIASGIPPRAASMRCGFNDYSTFYRSFKKYAKASPEEFKRALR